MGWKFQSNSPVYLQIASTIRADILSGKYAAEEQIPPVRQLAYIAAVNPNTMQRALSQLELDGLLYSKGTAGRFVTGDTAVLEKARHNAVNELLETFLQGCKQLGVTKDEVIQLLNKKEEMECQF
ncbi:MAG: GntR family transcriptional regulator [Clostridia bacterium]|nr:GntR family transcriptional regulator [Clostridia bacterium]